MHLRTSGPGFRTNSASKVRISGSAFRWTAASGRSASGRRPTSSPTPSPRDPRAPRPGRSAWWTPVVVGLPDNSTAPVRRRSNCRMMRPRCPGTLLRPLRAVAFRQAASLALDDSPPRLLARHGSQPGIGRCRSSGWEGCGWPASVASGRRGHARRRSPGDTATRRGQRMRRRGRPVGRPERAGLALARRRCRAGGRGRSSKRRDRPTREAAVGREDRPTETRLPARGLCSGLGRSIASELSARTHRDRGWRRST